MGQLALIGCIRSDLARGRANGFYAQGDNAEAAWLSGVALTLLIVFEHVLVAAFAWLAGLGSIGRTGSMQTAHFP